MDRWVGYPKNRSVPGAGTLGLWNFAFVASLIREAALSVFRAVFSAVHIIRAEAASGTERRWSIPGRRSTHVAQRPQFRWVQVHKFSTESGLRVKHQDL